MSFPRLVGGIHSLDHLDSCFRRACPALDAGNDIV